MTRPRGSAYRSGHSISLHVGADLDAAQHDPRRLGHRGPGGRDAVVHPIGVALDQQRVVHRGADLDAPLGGQTASQAQHLGAVGLHREVPQRRRPRRVLGPQRPPEHRRQVARSWPTSTTCSAHAVNTGNVSASRRSRSWASITDNPVRSARLGACIP